MSNFYKIDGTNAPMADDSLWPGTFLVLADDETQAAHYAIAMIDRDGLWPESEPNEPEAGDLWVSFLDVEILTEGAFWDKDLNRFDLPYSIVADGRCLYSGVHHIEITVKAGGMDGDKCVLEVETGEPEIVTGLRKGVVHFAERTVKPWAG